MSAPAMMRADMALRGIHHVQVNVTDVAAAVAFYEALGMTVRDDRPDFGVEGAWLSAGPEQQIHLIRAEPASDMGQHFALEVDDLDALLVRLSERGVDSATPRALAAHLGRQTSIADPDGNRIELREPPPPPTR